MPEGCYSAGLRLSEDICKLTEKSHSKKHCVFVCKMDYQKTLLVDSLHSNVCFSVIECTVVTVTKSSHDEKGDNFENKKTNTFQIVFNT